MMFGYRTVSWVPVESISSRDLLDAELLVNYFGPLYPDSLV